MGRCRSYTHTNTTPSDARQLVNPISNSREKPFAQIAVEVMSYCVIEVRMIPITYFISIQYCEMLQEYLSLEGYKHHPMCMRCTQNLQSVWPLASIACSDFCNICLTNLCPFDKERRTCPLPKQRDVIERPRKSILLWENETDCYHPCL